MDWDRYDLPEAVLEGYWPDETEWPLRQLRASCLRHLGEHIPVGEPFRFPTEQIRVNDKFVLTYDRWLAMTVQRQAIHLFCAECDKVTRQVPKGAVEVEV